MVKFCKKMRGGQGFLEIGFYVVNGRFISKYNFGESFNPNGDRGLLWRYGSRKIGVFLLASRAFLAGFARQKGERLIRRVCVVDDDDFVVCWLRCAKNVYTSLGPIRVLCVGLS